MDTDTLNLQHSIVKSLIQAMPGDWEHIIASYEIEDDDNEGKTQDTMVVYISRSGNDIKATSLESPPLTIAKAFFDLNQKVGGSAGERWSSAEVKVELDGSYNFKFSYDPPKRINGIFDEESYKKFGHYADVYKAERDSVQAA